MHNIFNTQFKTTIDAICESDKPREAILNPEKKEINQGVLSNIRCRNHQPYVLGKSRDVIKNEAMLESVYDKDGEENLENQKQASEKQSGKGLIHIYGYKHERAMKYYSRLLHCLKDCYEMRFERLNIDINFFLLLKNELSLHFLKKTDNIVATYKAALRIYAQENERDRGHEEVHELRQLEKILKNQAINNEDSDEEEEEKGSANDS